MISVTMSLLFGETFPFIILDSKEEPDIGPREFWNAVELWKVSFEILGEYHGEKGETVRPDFGAKVPLFKLK